MISDILLDKSTIEISVVEPKGEFALVEIQSEGAYEGARSYGGVA